MAWRSGQSYSQDLRDRVLAAVDGGKSACEVTPLFQVTVSYIYKARGRRRATDESTAKPRRGDRAQKLAEFGVSISTGAMWATLGRLDSSLKKRARHIWRSMV
jgi:transposase